MLDNMVVFNKYVMPTVYETLAQEYQKFNAASGGTIRLSAEGFEGNYDQESFYSSLAAAQRRVNRNGANGSATATNLAQLQKNGVKVAGGIGPIRYEPSQMTWLQKPTTEGIEIASRAFAELIMLDQLNTAIAAGIAAIGGDTNRVNDVSGSANISYAALNQSHAIFGDRSSALRAEIMDGATFHTLIGNNLGNAETLFRAENVRVVDILGKLVVVTDAPALQIDGTNAVVMSLVPGAIDVTGASDVITNIDTTNGNQRIETTLQADYSFGLHVKGFSWDIANGGSSPDDSALTDSANWDAVGSAANVIKDGAGVLTQFNPAA